MDQDNLYLILEAMYKKSNLNKENIFPIEWYNVQTYDLKKKILKECLDNNILIIDSSFYYDFKLLALNEVYHENN